VISDGFLKLESLDFFETPSPNEIVREKWQPETRQLKATKSDNEFVAFRRIHSLKFRRHSPLLSLEFVAICRPLPHLRRDFISL
jgi:hypothetical protein